MSIFRTKSIEDVLKNSQIDVHGDPVPGRGIWPRTCALGT